MRGYESPNPSSRVAWGVAGVVGLLLFVWAFGWLGVGGPETGSLLDDPVTARFDELDPVPFSGLPDQFEPEGEAEVVDVPPAGGPDPWNPPEKSAALAEIPSPDSFDPPEFGPKVTQIPLPELGPPADGEQLPTAPDDLELHDPIDPGILAGAPLDSIAEYPLAPSAEPSPEPSTQLPPRPPLERSGSPYASLDLSQIDRLIRVGQVADAHAALSRIWNEHPQARPTIQHRIDTTARAVYFDPEPHVMEPYLVKAGDTLRNIGGEYGVPWEYIVRLNRVDPRRIRPGQPLKVIKGPFHAHVDLSEFTLTVHNNGHYVKQYAIGIGRDGSTPVGRYTVKDKVTNPQYTASDGHVISGDDPNNPVGERWLSLGGSYGIHGTIMPDSIGRAESEGCVRLRSGDVEELYDLLGVGSSVVIEP